LFSVLGASNSHQDEIFANWFSNDHSHPLVISKGADAGGICAGEPAPGRRGRRDPGQLPYVGVLHPQAAPALGIGRDAAKLIFDRFAGDWEIVEYQRNPSAVTFWRHVLSLTVRAVTPSVP
jgi:hypothetical protein